MTAEICLRSIHNIPPSQFVTHLKKIMIDYFKGLLMTHHLDILISGKNWDLNIEYNLNIMLHVNKINKVIIFFSDIRYQIFGIASNKIQLQ